MRLGRLARHRACSHCGIFSKEEIRELYMQHTRETGQQWDEAYIPHGVGNVGVSDRKTQISH